MTSVVSMLPNRSIAPNNNAIADRLEALAASIRAGEKGEVRHVLVVVAAPPLSLAPYAYGERATRAEVVGLLQFAAQAEMTEER